jgi:hypothetical protein
LGYNTYTHGNVTRKLPVYPILNKQKCHFFSVFFCKIGEQEVRTGPALWGRVATSERREEVGKGCRRVSMVQILSTHVCKWKNETC